MCVCVCVCVCVWIEILSIHSVVHMHTAPHPAQPLKYIHVHLHVMYQGFMQDFLLGGEDLACKDLLLHSGRCYEAEICAILFLLRCPFIW